MFVIRSSLRRMSGCMVFSATASSCSKWHKYAFVHVVHDSLESALTEQLNAQPRGVQDRERRLKEILQRKLPTGDATILEKSKVLCLLRGQRARDKPRPEVLF